MKPFGKRGHAVVNYGSGASELLLAAAALTDPERASHATPSPAPAFGTERFHHTTARRSRTR